MPIYDYCCPECGGEMEVLLRVGDPVDSVRCRCGATMDRVPGAANLRFKGDGFYATEHKRVA